MKPYGPAGAIIGGAILLAIAVWGTSEGRLPTPSQMVGDITAADTPRIFWTYVSGLGVIGLAALIWGLIANFRR